MPLKEHGLQGGSVGNSTYPLRYKKALGGGSTIVSTLLRLPPLAPISPRTRSAASESSRRLSSYSSRGSCHGGGSIPGPAVSDGHSAASNTSSGARATPSPTAAAPPPTSAMAGGCDFERDSPFGLSD